MKILLLTNIPPCKTRPQGLVLDQLCRFIHKESMVCYTVLEPGNEDYLSSDLDYIPIEYVIGYHREAFRPVYLPRKLRGLISHFVERKRGFLEKMNIVPKIIKFAQYHNVNRVWCCLEGQTMIRLALPVAQELGVPLLTQVFDPPLWELRSHHLTRISQDYIIKQFEHALLKSSSCATASWEMAHQYQQDYGTKSVPVIQSLNARLAQQPGESMHSEKEFVIGVAGKLYAHEEWYALLDALDVVNWNIDGRDIIIRICGSYIYLKTTNKKRIQYFGYCTLSETIKLMSTSDVLYCPYWLNPSFEIQASLSFPSKLISYLAAGRPVLFHGPSYSAPARYLFKNNAGIFCTSNSHEDIINAIHQIIKEPSIYKKLSINASKAFHHDFTLEVMRKNFADFLGVDETNLIVND